MNDVQLDSVFHKIEMKCLKRADLVEFILFVKKGLENLYKSPKHTKSVWIKK